jgi:hypothetical protein
MIFAIHFSPFALVGYFHTAADFVFAAHQRSYNR